ncbi:MAG: DUF1990 family protein [Gemmatimonadota bacterium]
MKIETLRELWEGRAAAGAGAGPLYQRDYWAVIRDCRDRPSRVVDLVARRFPDFAPPKLVRFRRLDGDRDRPLEVGDEMDVDIRGAGRSGVRVVHRDAASLTLATLRGHPETGRITFGAYRNARGDVLFHIRSRARSSSERTYLGYRVLGEAMQTNVWTDFINRIAATVGEGVAGHIHAERRRLRELPPDADAIVAPTYIARAD